MILESLFEFDADSYSRVDLVDYAQEDCKHIRVNQFGSEGELVDFAKSVVKADFHDDSFFTSMLIVKRMLFLNLFEQNSDFIQNESGNFEKEAFGVRRHKLFQYRTLVFIIKSFILFFTKIKELSNTLETLKIFFSFEICEREIRQIFKNLEKFFTIDQNYVKSKSKN